MTCSVMFWFQTTIKYTRKWRKLLKSETNTESEMNFRILPIYFFFGIKSVRVCGKILWSVGRSETYIFFLALWCPELIPDIEKFLPIAILKMAATIPHKFNIVRFQRNFICSLHIKLFNLPARGTCANGIFTSPPWNLQVPHIKTILSKV